jgi:hypothetical protein
LDGMLHFYCDVLGCTIERRQESIGLVQLRAGRSISFDDETGSDGIGGGSIQKESLCFA